MDYLYISQLAHLCVRPPRVCLASPMLTWNQKHIACYMSCNILGRENYWLPISQNKQTKSISNQPFGALKFHTIPPLTLIKNQSIQTPTTTRAPELEMRPVSLITWLASSELVWHASEPFPHPSHELAQRLLLRAIVVNLNYVFCGDGVAKSLQSTLQKKAHPRSPTYANEPETWFTRPFHSTEISFPDES